MNSSTMRSPKTATRMRANSSTSSRSRPGSTASAVAGDERVNKTACESQLSQDPGNRAHEIVGDGRGTVARAFDAIAVAGADEHPLRADGRAGGDVVRAIADDERLPRGRSDARRPRAAAVPAAACGSRTPDGRLRLRPQDDAGRSRSRRRARRRRPSVSASDRCVASTNASSKNPRAMPAWLVATITTTPARFEQPDRVDAIGKEADAIDPIEIAHLFDEGAIAIQKHASPHVRTSSLPYLVRSLAHAAPVAAPIRVITLSTTSPAVIPFMQR